ncbi:peroxiredoxin [Candidatus Dependentiae bacterium HGW-Dependentiae-1]|nr:MAG: peroxiredoxin [Candidatus Dependentiae bacterium HGW-Dependentiae-1]
MCIFSKPLSTGKLAPNFSLPDQDNKLRTLSEFRGSYVVLYFYPKDNTPGCTKEACGLRDNFDTFAKQSIIIVGVSYDSPETHAQFKEKHQLPFTLLSDTDKKVAHLYGANRKLIPLPQRMTFIINPQGIICAILPKVDVTTHATDILELIEQDEKNNT